MKKQKFLQLRVQVKELKTGQHAATITSNSPTAILLGARASAIMNEDGQISESTTEASGLDFSGVGPEVTYLAKTGRIQFRATTDLDAQHTFQMMTRKVGILPAIEPCFMIHAALEEIKKRKIPVKITCFIFVALESLMLQDNYNLKKIMNKNIKVAFDKAKKENRAALIGYVVGCDPTFEDSKLIINEMLRYCDLIEVGIPFNTSTSDSATIMDASMIGL